LLVGVGVLACLDVSLSKGFEAELSRRCAARATFVLAKVAKTASA
jgi:hypothetical protein